MAFLAACNATDPLEAALPPLPPEGGPALAAAGRLTAENFTQEAVPGPASQGLVGDFFMRNDKVRLVVQAPGRAIGPCPFGGNVIDFDRVDDPAGDQLGEVSPFLQLGRTIAFDRAEIVRDGSRGGPAVLRFYGHDAKNDFINLPGVGSFAVGIADDYRADFDLKWRAAVTYILMPGETTLRMIYTFHNTGEFDSATLWGTLSNTGAGPEIFHEGMGYGELGFDDLLGARKNPPVRYMALDGRGIAYGVLPIFEDKGVTGAAVPIAGVDVEVYDVKEAFDAFGPDGQSLRVKQNGTETREVDLVLGRDVAEVTEQVAKVRGDVVEAFSGVVTGGAGARVAVLDGAGRPVTVATTDAEGRFRGAVPPGKYTFQAEGDAWRRGPAVEATVPATELTLTIPALAKLDYTVKDRAGNGIPARITVVGAPAATPDRRFRDTLSFYLPNGVANWAFTRYGDSSRGTAFDEPLHLVPGRYRVVISRGPEWSRFEQVLDVPAAGARVDAVLTRIVDTSGYVVADFHQHSWMSPDATAPPQMRVMSYLADGGEFISSSEHDVVFDYAPVIDSLGASDLLDSSIGCEITAWDYGHFIGFPYSVDPMSPNGGAFDWAGGELGLSVPPPKIFEGIRQQGVRVVQVNHPRSPPGDFSSFQQAFDRAGLRFDFATRSFFGDAKLMPVSAMVLGVEEGEPMFAPTFDAVEIYNGHHLPEMVMDGERMDVNVDYNLRDWMNFLSFGFTPVPTGVSDAHGRHADVGAMPRTLVRVPDDSPAAIAAGLEEPIIRTLTGQGVNRDVIVTNGPFVQLSVDGTGIGGTVAHASGPLAIKVTVQTPAWAPVDTVEIFANNTFDIPLPKGMEPQPLVPALCYTTKVPASARCAMAIGGARPLDAAVQIVERVSGDPSTRVQEITLEIDDVDPDMLLSRNRSGAVGRDLWLVARVSGDVGMFPVIPHGVAAAAAALVDNPVLAGDGVPALAFTNAVFVDVDGGGWRGPFQP